METNANPNNMNLNMGDQKHVPTQKILFSTLILVVMVTVFYAGQMYERKRSETNPEAVQVTAKTIDEGAQENWGVFSNDVMGIKFEYPLLWGEITSNNCNWVGAAQSQIISPACGEISLSAVNYLGFSNQQNFLNSTPRPTARDGWYTDTHWIKSQSDIDTYCQDKGKRPKITQIAPGAGGQGVEVIVQSEIVSCDVYTNKNGIKVARISEGESEGLASSITPPRVLYYIYTGLEYFPAISFNSKPENQNVMDRVVDSLKLLRVN
jgi:hypothetical protein